MYRLNYIKQLVKSWLFHRFTYPCDQDIKRSFLVRTITVRMENEERNWVMRQLCFLDKEFNGINELQCCIEDVRRVYSGDCNWDKVFFGHKELEKYNIKKLSDYLSSCRLDDFRSICVADVMYDDEDLSCVIKRKEYFLPYFDLEVDIINGDVNQVSKVDWE